MPESRVVPPGRAICPVPLPEGSLDRIRARAQRRKTMRATVVGGAGSLALVVAASLVAATGITETSEDSLHIVPAVPYDRPVPALDSPALTSGPDELAARSTSAGAGGAGAAAGPEAKAQSGAATEAARSAAAPEPLRTASTPAAQRRYDPDAVRNDARTVMLPPDCEQVGTGSIDGWCLTGWITEEELILTLCRARAHGAAQLEWATSQRVRIEVHDPSGKVIWSHDPKVRPVAGRTHVPAESCIGWEVPYRMQDEQDQPLPPGDYRMRAASTALSLQDAWTETSFRVAGPGEEPIEVGAAPPPVRALSAPGLG